MPIDRNILLELQPRRLDIRLLTIIIFVFSVSSCDQFETQTGSFEWLIDGYETRYDFVPSTSDSLWIEGGYLRSAKEVLSVVASGQGRAYSIQTIPIEEQYHRAYSIYFISSFDPERGLTYTRGTCCKAGQSCWIAACNIRLYVRVPLFPEIGDYVGKSFRVEWIDENVTVPAGTFNSFAFVSTSLRVREVWSSEVGLVRIDLLNSDSETIGAFELSSVRL